MEHVRLGRNESLAGRKEMAKLDRKCRGLFWRKWNVVLLSLLRILLSSTGEVGGKEGRTGVDRKVGDMGMSTAFSC